MMFFLIRMKEPFMIIIERRFCSIKMKCRRRILNSIALGSIFGSILQRNAIKDLTMMREDFLVFIVMCLRKSRLKKPKLSSQGMIWNKKWENMKDLVLQQQISIKFLDFMRIGKTSQLTKHSCGLNNMTLEMLRTVGLSVVCNNRTKSKE